MPLPKSVENGYRGVEIRGTKLGFVVVVMSHNRHRFATMDEAHQFIKDAIDRHNEQASTDPLYRLLGRIR